MIKQNIAEGIFSIPDVYMPIVFSYSSIERTRRMNLIKKNYKDLFLCFLNYFITLLKQSFWSKSRADEKWQPEAYFEFKNIETRTDWINKFTD